MSEITLFHGSKKIINSPYAGGSKAHNDFGPGFYLTAEEDMAGQWAVDRGVSGYINRYTFDPDGLRILDFMGDDFSVLHWLALILENRKLRVSDPGTARILKYLKDYYSLPVQDYDAVRGMHCSLSYFTFTKWFLNNEITVRQFSRILKLAASSEEYALLSPQAFENLQFESCRIADAVVYYPRKKKRDMNARVGVYVDLEKHSSDDLYIMDIVREEVKPGDKRLR